MRISDWSSDVCSSDLRWAKALELTTDLVQVLCSQAATDFQYFYELLMARRLLRARFLSLDIERQALSALPAMNKARLMRSEERRVGKECVSTCRSRWSP